MSRAASYALNLAALTQMLGFHILGGGALEILARRVQEALYMPGMVNGGRKALESVGAVRVLVVL